MGFHDKPPDAETLTDFGVTFWKKAETIRNSNDQIPQILGRFRIVNSDGFHNSAQIHQKGLFENYFEVHSFRWVRTCAPECPRLGVASA